MPETGLTHENIKWHNTTAFVTLILEHWLERELVQWVNHEGSIRRPIVPRANALNRDLHLVLYNVVSTLFETSDRVGAWLVL